jgi:alpha-D-xyloside xylohydrolase
MKNSLFFILIFLILASCSEEDYKVEQSGVVVFPKEVDYAGAVRITVIRDDIIKVETSATLDFDTTRSLIETVPFGNQDFEVTDSGKEVILTTPKLNVRVSKKSGAVEFYDQVKNKILAERRDHDNTFSPVVVDGVKGFSLRRQFDSPEREALYGLGQHQAHDINYKGKNEELFQYNTKVSIPFIVSTRNYGVLWDNYSLSRFGDPRPYSNIDLFVLYDKTGKEGGLTATYVDNREDGHIYLERKEKSIDYENLETVTRFPEGFDFSNAIVNWEGDIESTESGIYRFLCYYAGYTKLWIDGELYFDRWRTAWNPSVAKFDLEMTQGDKHHLKMEWIPDGGISYIGLKALSPVDPQEQNRLSFYSEMGKDIRYYFMKGESMDEVISHYRTVTGKAQVMPEWSMGFWQSRERYKTQDELLGVLREFRKRHIPIDNIVQDWSYWPVDQWGSHDFDLDRFPDAGGMVDEVHELNAHIMISVWPKFYVNTEHFKEFDRNGWMYRRAVEDSIRDWIWPGYIGSFYDAYSPGARKLFWEQIREKLYARGFDAWWLDATEPDILSNASISYRKALMNPTALGLSTQYFNAYALVNAEGIYKGQRSVNNDNRVFILTRSGFPGIQGYGAVTWSGDIGTRWEDMEAQITAGINFALSGLPYWTMDIGGFCVEKRYETAREGSEDLEEWRELNTRWYQFGAFVPLFRVHGQFPYREVYNLAPESHPAYQSMLYYNKLRYKLMPYIYSLAGWVYLSDYTMMRGLAMDFAGDERVWNIGDQYMFGPSMMVCPVYRYKARSRTVYLPEGAGWYDAYTGKYFIGGGEMEVGAPYEKMPLFVRAGSVLPLGPDIEYTDQKPADPLTLLVYTGVDASFELYEDDGNNYDYERGLYSIIPIHWSEKDRVLNLGERQGTFEGMIENRTFRIVFISSDNPVGIDDKSDHYEEISYNGNSLTIAGR